MKIERFLRNPGSSLVKVRIEIAAVLAAIGTACWLQAADSGAPPSDPLAERFRAGVTILAADGMEGRGLGTKGLGLSADWIESQLREAKLQPLFEGSYRQSFKVKTGVSLAPGNDLSGVAAADWIPLGIATPGAFSGELAFAGYGIEAPPLGYRELDGIDLRGKVALMLRFEPQEKDDASIFDGRKPSRWSALRYKVHQARERGAVAVVFVTGPLQDEGKDLLPPLRNEGPESPAGIPVLQVKLSVAKKWLAPHGIDLEKFQMSVDRDLRPRSTGSAGVMLHGTVALETTWAEAQNVVGVIPGRGALAKDYVVIGAHYDHLGMGGEHSMKPNVTAIHHGADDNASGTVAVILAGGALREHLAAEPNHRTVVVALFSGEEVGLAGSAAFVEKKSIPLDKTIAMVNLDMVGRLRENKLVALGAESAAEWSPALVPLAARASLDLVSRGDGYGPSDQTSFYAVRIPVLHLFTGAHEQYHTPEDTADTVNAEGGAKITRFAESVVEEVVSGRLTPKYARAQAAPAMSGDSRGFGAYLGTIPDYSAMESTEGGVLLADVRPGGPADLAGIRGKDRIVEMAGARIENLYDMTFVLQDHKPGDTIVVIVIRAGERVRLRATLGSRGVTNPAPEAAHAPAGAPAAPPAAAPPTGKPPHPDSSIPSPSADRDSDNGAGKDKASWKLDAFYEGRPGPNFEVKAGQPFAGRFEGERHFKETRQLTFEGENAEAYFSPDGRKLVYQWTPRGVGCDQEYVLDLETGFVRRISSGKGRTTCGYYRWPQGDKIIFASTESASPDCPPPADMSQGYVWALSDGYDVWETQDCGESSKPMMTSPGYDAEATWCHRGGKFVFTSRRDGDIDLYTMDEAGEVTRLTATEGYDGGAFFSPDCSEIVWRASRPKGAELDEYRKLLARGLIHPRALEVYVMKSDGTNVRQVTSNGAANFCPFFHPDGRRIIFASNAGSKDGREFDLWMVDKNGGDPERITTAPGFDGFPQWSPDGRWIVWGSNRADPKSHETNLFIAKWVE